jgi:Flp pilus assembly protein TadB
VTVAGWPMRSKSARRLLVVLLLLCCAAGVAEAFGANAVASVCLVVAYVVGQVALVVGYVLRARRERQR